MKSQELTTDFRPNRELQYRTSWTELFLGLVLWSLLAYGWRRALSYSTSADVAYTFGFTVGTIVVYAAIVTAWIWSRTKAAQRRLVSPVTVDLCEERVVVS
jgi:hypothetical protein